MYRSVLFSIVLGLLCFSPLFSQPSSENSLIASTYLGGASIELFVMELDEFGLLQHPNGDIYICGPTESADFPTTPGAVQPYHAGGDAESFVARLTPDLARLEASTYLGGSAMDIASDMILDIDGNICVVGHTASDDFPVTSNAYDTTLIPQSWDQFDVFITILTPDLDSIIASTYIGGSHPDYFNQIRVTMDYRGNIIVAGATISGDYPVTPNAYMNTGGTNTGPDAFISKLSPDLSTLEASTYFGGSALEQVLDLRCDQDNSIIICGITGSPNLPTTPTAYITSLSGDGDGYIARLGPDLDTLIASTYLGGGSFDNIFSMDLDTSGNIYVCGYTESIDFPITSGVYDSTFNYGTFDGYISILDPALENLIASTFLGSSGWDFCRDILYDQSLGDVFITGLAGAANFPVTNHSYDTSFNGEADLFASRMTGSLNRLISSTFVGGEWDDFGLELVISQDDNIFIGGNTYSDEFPTTPGAYNEESNGSYDATISLINKDLTGVMVGVKELPGPEVMIYPNPCSGALHLRYLNNDPSASLGTGSGYLIFDLYTIDGRRILRMEEEVGKGKNEISLDVSHLLPGIYILKVQADKYILSHKLIIQ